jgi:N-methylhydantoinase A
LSKPESGSVRNANFRCGIGVDVGGTFTDVAIVHPGGVWRAKSPTTHGDVGRGVIAGIELACADAGLSVAQLLPRVERFGLGTTAVTNVIAEVHGRRVGLLTTRGFENELALARGIRFSVTGRVRAPGQIVPRTSIAGIDERMDHVGAILRPLDASQVLAVARRLIEEAAVEVIAVSFVNSYRNDVHEHATVALIRKHFPTVGVVSAAALGSTFGFLKRTMFAALNAFCGSAFAGVDELAASLQRSGLSCPIRLVSSTGGLIGIDTARGIPMMLMQSGPAAGVAAAAALARRLKIRHALACDLGGTSFDISIVDDGTPQRLSEAEILRVPTGMSLVDVHSVGAGGGSIGWTDSRGMLRVGPKSAGSRPGPACYGWGGVEPTLTDALVVLGYIDPQNFLGGRMRLDRARALEACERVGRALALSSISAAWGIRQIALENMVRAAQRILQRRGRDPRDYAIISYGGCGGLFNVEIAKILGMSRVVAPDTAAVLSAFGAISAPLRRERTRSVVQLFPKDASALSTAFKELEAQVLTDLASDQGSSDGVSVAFEAALRFKRQAAELSIPVRMDLPAARMLEQVLEDFRDEYARRYGKSSIVLGAPIELVALCAIGSGSPYDIALNRSATTIEVTEPSAGRREVWFGENTSADTVAVIDGAVLKPGHRIMGPACIDGRDTTIWLPAGTTATVDHDRTVVVDIAPAPTSQKLRTVKAVATA